MNVWTRTTLRSRSHALLGRDFRAAGSAKALQFASGPVPPGVQGTTLQSMQLAKSPHELVMEGMRFMQAISRTPVGVPVDLPSAASPIPGSRNWEASVVKEGGGSGGPEWSPCSLAELPVDNELSSRDRLQELLEGIEAGATAMEPYGIPAEASRRTMTTRLFFDIWCLAIGVLEPGVQDPALGAVILQLIAAAQDDDSNPSVENDAKFEAAAAAARKYLREIRESGSDPRAI